MIAPVFGTWEKEALSGSVQIKYWSFGHGNGYRLEIFGAKLPFSTPTEKFHPSVS